MRLNRYLDKQIELIATCEDDICPSIVKSILDNIKDMTTPLTLLQAYQKQNKDRRKTIIYLMAQDVLCEKSLHNNTVLVGETEVEITSDMANRRSWYVMTEALADYLTS